MRPRSLLLFATLPLLALIGACEQLLQDDTLTVPVFEVRSGPFTEAEAKELLQALGVPASDLAEAEVLNEHGAVSWIHPDRFLHLPLQGRGSGFSEEDGEEYALYAFDFELMDALGEPPDARTTADEVASSLRTLELHPDQLLASSDATVETATGHNRFEMTDMDDNARFDLLLDTHVDFVSRLATDAGDLRLIGPGASFKVVVDDEGPVMVHVEHWELEPVGTVEVLAADDVRADCEASFASTTSATELNLVYYAPPFAASPDRVYPYYLCEGELTVDAGEGSEEAVQARPTFQPAAVEAPRVFDPHDSDLPRRGEDAVEASVAPHAFGVHDAGTEWIGESDGLSGSRRNAGRFYDEFQSVGDVVAQFNWGDENAWERDFKDAEFGGTDHRWIDDVDVAFYTGHANANGFTFVSDRDDGFLHRTEARWGNRDLEWLVIAACGPLQDTSGGLTWGQRWIDSFHRLHLLMAYANVSHDNQREGRIFARAILGEGESAKPVRRAWVKAATEVQPETVTYAIMGVADETGMANWNDYFWGRGSGGGPDIVPTDITYRWRLSGPS